MLEAALFGNVSPKPEPNATEMPGTPAPRKPEEALHKISFNFQQSGPYNMAQLLSMAKSGQITREATGFVPPALLNGRRLPR
jgi:hypothetical protein